MKSLARIIAFVLMVSFAASIPPPLNAATTDTFRDEFNNESYSGNDGTGSWASAWWESEAVQDPTKDDIRVVDDGGEKFALQFDNTPDLSDIVRTADLSAYDSAVLSFDYRRNNVPASAVFRISVSATGPAGLFTDVFTIASGDDAAYIGSGLLDISSHMSGTTTIRLSQEGDIGGAKFYLDNIEISASTGNLPPVAVDDDVFTPLNTSVIVDVLANDSDPDAEPLTVGLVTQGANGSVVNNGTDVTYTPNLDFRGIDTFTYTATDGNGGTDTATVTVGIGGVCYVVGDDGGTDALALVSLVSGLENYVGPTGTSGITAAAIHPLSGTVYASLPGQLGTVDSATGLFTPTSAPFGASFDNVQAIGFDADGSLYAFHHQFGPSDLLIRVDPLTGVYIPDAFGPGLDSVPLNSYSPEQQSVVGIDFSDFGQMFGITSNDGPQYVLQWISKANGSAFTVWSASSVVDVSFDATGRLWSLSPSGTLSEPFGTSHVLSGLTGYRALACEGGLANQSPLAVDDLGTTLEDSAVTVDVLANDSDPDLDPLLISAVTQGTHGTVVNNGSDVTYTPDLDWSGTDIFSYAASDGNGGFASAQVTVTVLAQPDPPVAVDDVDTTVEDTAVTVDVLVNDSDPDLDSLSVSGVAPGAGGSVVNNGSDVTYSPNAGWSGIDTFTYTVTDGNGGFASAQVTVTVTAANDDPIAVDDTDTTLEDSAVTVDVLANDSDPDLDPLLISAVTQGTHGTVVNNGSDVTYTPDLDWSGTDIFSYAASDGNGGFASAQVTVTVTATNDGPVAMDDSKTMSEDSFHTISVLGNDSDPDGDPLTITGVVDGSNGTVTNNGSDVTYTPSLDWNGTDTFTYTVSDGNGGSASASVTVTVTPVNDDPQGQPDSTSTPEDTAVTVDVLANDADVDSAFLTITAVADGSKGTVTTDGVTVTYTPGADRNGIDTFTYRVADDLGGWCETTVTVNVTPVNDDPVAVDDTATTMQDEAVYVWVLANDSDPDLDGLSVLAVSDGSHGFVVNNGFKVTYTPNPGWTGLDTFTYTVSDGNDAFDSSTVTVTVTAGPNQPPVANDDTSVTDEDGAATIQVLANDSDPDGDVVAVHSVNQGAHGSVSKTATDITYTPDENWSGIDSFSYTITDGRGGTATAAVVVRVQPLNDPPFARDDGASTQKALPVTVGVLANDSDADGDLLVVAAVSGGSHGATATDGVSVTYAPAPGYSGTDAFSYTIIDGHGGSATATVTVTVAATDEDPVAAAGAGTSNQPPVITLSGDTIVAEGDSLTLDIRAEDPDGDEVSISATGLPEWASLVDHGDGVATISGSPGFAAAATSDVMITASDGTVNARWTATIEVIDVNRVPLFESITFGGVQADSSFSFAVSASDPDGDPLWIFAEGLPSWSALTDHGGGSATISSDGVPDAAMGSFSVIVSVTDGMNVVTSRLERPIAELRNGRPAELTHQVYNIEGAGALVATALKPRVGTPNPPGAHLTPREGLMVAFGSAVETLKNQVVPAIVLGVVMAWMLMIGVGRTKEEEEPEPA